MKISVPTMDGMLPDRYGKYAPDNCKIEGHPCVSFPIDIEGVPPQAKSLALAFLDYDAVPVGGFCWIHWLACNIDPRTTIIPDNASARKTIPMVQGSNSDWSPLAGGWTDPAITQRYAGPYPPDKDHTYTLLVYALDTMLKLKDGYFLNDFRRAIAGHVLDVVELEIPSRA